MDNSSSFLEILTYLDYLEPTLYFGDLNITETYISVEPEADSCAPVSCSVNNSQLVGEREEEVCNWRLYTSISDN